MYLRMVNRSCLPLTILDSFLGAPSRQASLVRGDVRLGQFPIDRRSGEVRPVAVTVGLLEISPPN